MSRPNIEALQKLLREAERRVQDERASREEADAARVVAERRVQDERASREEADAARVAAERRVQDERASREEAERRLNNTTLVEYLRLCHQHLFLNITIQADKSLTSTGGITKPDGKTHPRHLAPWDKFLPQQKNVLTRLYSAYPPEHGQRVFESEHSVESQGKRIKTQPLGYEADLHDVQRQAVEIPASFILNHLCAVDPVIAQFKLGGHVTFEHQPHALSDESEEVVRRSGQRTSGPSTPAARIRGSKFPATDQVCVYVEGQGKNRSRRLAFLIERKPPHKMPLALLQAGLRQMELRPDVIDRPTIPSPEDEDAHLRYHSDRLVAAAVTQIYSYMIECGVQYGYITTGQAFVFLHVPLDDPATILYHLVDPSADVASQRDQFPQEDWSHRTALAQILAFSLLALESKSETNRWRESLIAQLSPWEVDYDAILREIPPSTRKAASTSSYRPSTYRLEDRSPIKLRSMNGAGCRSPEASIHDDAESPGSDSDFNDPDTPTRDPGADRTRRAPQPTSSTGANSTASDSRRQHRRREFCTHDCLRGLTRADFLDPKCPNVPAHRGHDGRHRIDRTSFLRLLHRQLKRTLDNHFEPMGMEGARGVLFRVTLASYGYTLVAKGTVEAFVDDIRHEAVVYDHLRALQGVSLPVCLGSIDFSHPYYYDKGVRIMHILLLSWAGRRIDDPVSIMDNPRMKSKIAQAFKGLRDAGIQHNDESSRNILWDDRVRRIMVIDFERAGIVRESPPLLLSPSSGNKRRREPLEADGLGIRVKPT
ncbi:MAG: hypothetical protein M1838_002071 [Thelocarpon superellum]|nr:MAG: hypothetical protein M1838_002071 [Thelocarpon superellum]